jgi:hypothetical protein
MSAKNEFVRGAVSFSALSVYGAAIVCGLCWLLFLALYDAENLRLGGRSVFLNQVDAYGRASVLGERLRNVPGQGPLIFYAGSSLARNAISSPDALDQALHEEMGEVDFRAISVGGFTLWEIEALAANLDPGRERVFLLPVSIGRLQFGREKLKGVASEERLLFSDGTYWGGILEEEKVEYPPSLGFMALDNFAYVAKRKKGVVRQFWLPPADLVSWHGSVAPEELLELEKMWLDPTYKPEGKVLRNNRKGFGNAISLPGARVMAGWNGMTMLNGYTENADVAQGMLVRSIERLNKKNIRVVMFETPMDVEAIRQFRGEKEAASLIADFYSRIERVSQETNTPLLLIGKQADFPTTKFSDWVHVVEEEARLEFTRMLAKELAQWHQPERQEGAI